jgi:hypothetical protein
MLHNDSAKRSSDRMGAIAVLAIVRRIFISKF